MRTKLLFLLYIWAFYALAAPLRGASYGQSSGLLLGETLGVRPMGLAGAYVSFADDEASISSNPAGLAKIQGFSISGGQLFGLLGTQVSQISLVSALSPGAVTGVQTAYLYDTDIRRDSAGVELGTFNNSNLLAAAGFGLGLTPQLRIGGSIKALQESYDGSQTLSIVGDAGIQGPLYKSVRFGLVGQNLGANTPMRIQGGVSLPMFTKLWRLALEAQGLPAESQIRVLVGTELKVDLGEGTRDERPMRAAIRFGYASPVLAGELGRLSLGAGLELPPTYALDYALLSVGELGASHRVSLALRFPGAKLPAPPSAQLGQPKGLRVVQQADGIMLMWDDLGQRTDGYNLYADYGVLVDRLNDKPVQGSLQKLIKVDRGRTYHFYVRPVGSDAKEGPSSEVLEYKAP